MRILAVVKRLASVIVVAVVVVLAATAPSYAEVGTARPYAGAAPSQRGYEHDSRPRGHGEIEDGHRHSLERARPFVYWSYPYYGHRRYAYPYYTYPYYSYPYYSYPAPAYWYYCPAYEDYYPNVNSCPVAWVPVPAS